MKSVYLAGFIASLCLSAQVVAQTSASSVKTDAPPPPRMEKLEEGPSVKPEKILRSASRKIKNYRKT
jgi:hypothetical protein